MTDREYLERLISKTEAMRAAQRSYFASPNNISKKLAIALESGIDLYLKELRRRGFNPKEEGEQNKIF